MAFWLSFTRWSAVLIQMPIFNCVGIPGIVKILMSVLVTYAFFPYLKSEMIKDINFVGEQSFWILTVFNAVVGLTIGYFVQMMLHIFSSACSIISQHIGFASIRYFDPTSQQTAGPIEILINWTLLIMIVSSGALLPMFKGVFASFHSIHISDLGAFSNVGVYFLNYFKSVFLLSLVLASPIIFTNLLVNSVLGIIARFVPQMNVLILSFAVQIGLGLAVFFITHDEFFESGYQMYVDKLADWYKLLL